MVTDWHYNWVNHLVGLAATSNVWSRMVSEIQCQVIIIYYDDQKNQRYHDPTRSSFPTCLLILMVTWPPFSLLRLLGLLSETLSFFLLPWWYSITRSLKSASSRDSRTTLTSQVRLDKIYIYTSTLSAQRTKFFFGAALTKRFLSRGRPERERRLSSPSNQPSWSIFGSHSI